MASQSKSKRQSKLEEYLANDPFITDDDLAKIFGVSVQTVRLDRLRLGIPELRERVKLVAKENYGKMKTMAETDLVGELIDLVIGESGMSMMAIEKEMVFKRSDIARGHHIFAQANSLAVAVVDADMALTGTAKVLYKRPVHLGEKVTAKAVVAEVTDNKYRVTVISKVNLEEVFRGSFVVFAIDDKGGKEA